MVYWVWDTLVKFYIGIAGGLTVLAFKPSVESNGNQLFWVWIIVICSAFLFNYYASLSK